MLAAPLHVPPKRYLLEFFRRGGDERALSVQALDALERVIGTNLSDYIMNIAVKEALRTRSVEAETVIMKELAQMITKKVWTPVDTRKLTADERLSVISSSMFVKQKFHPNGEHDKLKARLVAGGDQQNEDLYDDLSAPTVSTCSVFTVLAITGQESRFSAVVDISGAFLNAEMDTGVVVHMRLDKVMSSLLVKLSEDYTRMLDSKGCVVVRLNKALYGCVESAALWYENLRHTMEEMGYRKNEYDVCVFNRVSEGGIQCTATVHVDDLLIRSRSKEMIEELCTGLKKGMEIQVNLMAQFLTTSAWF